MAEEQKISWFAELAQLLGGLVLVLGLILGLAYLVRRLNLTQLAQGAITTKAVTSLGGKEKLTLVQLGDKQYLLGVTAHNISLIDTISPPIDIPATGLQAMRVQAKDKQAQNKENQS
ncbi:flagellar biosynthetic protein FliO [Paraferrimonas sedimenticola]|uniref:Flagellar protein n=1 Tax=Paraferrimonas sedimenticola TaxID=375674 RepID=A0AA37RRZ9_9GAMM|nr:flagellar biosynthetic protein FliO [Paraferrimonas sedimenticola]GLP94965.1 hypothetical protein GCM10007895_02710 [Paraferrimonas sedimenticola]